MTYTNDPINPVNRGLERIAVTTPVDYHDRVRWGPIFAGLVTAISAQLVLSGIGAAVGLSTIANSGAPPAQMLMQPVQPLAFGRLSAC
jgi:hypothetical protein